MAGWWADRFVAFDTETSGVNVESDAIITAAVIHVQPGRDVVLREWLLHPGDAVVTPESEAVHGISDAYARTHGAPPDLAIAEIAGELRSGWASGETVCGFNLAFDLTLLDRANRRQYDRPFEIMGPIADGFILDKWADKYRKGSRKLAAVAEHYEIKIDGALHGAATDALVSARLVWKLARVFPELGAMSARDLYRLQVAARREQAAGLQDHLRAKARDEGADPEDIEEIVVDPHWPIKPFAAATTEQGAPA